MIAPPYTLRPAAGADFEFMRRVGHEGLRPYIEAVTGWDEAYHTERFREKFAPGRQQVIQVDGRDAGYLDVVENGEAFTVEGIYLDAPFRNRGLGTAILRDVLDRAGRAGKPVRLRVLLRNPARRLYERLGFRVTATTETQFMMEHPVPGNPGR
jgi:GNAT superfamily N-acetyltransferase